MKSNQVTGLIAKDTREPLTMGSSSLMINIDGCVSSVLAHLTYSNQLDHEVRGVFVYNDSGSFITALHATVNNQNISITTIESSKYNEKDPRQTTNGFQINIGSIPPQGKVVLEINVLGNLETAGEALRFKTTQVFTPLLRGNRVSQRPRESGRESDVITRHYVKQPYIFDMRIRACMPCLLAGCFSPSHAIQVDADAYATNAETVMISLAEKYNFDREIEILFYLSQPLESYVTIEVGKSSRLKEPDFLNDAIIAVSFMPDLPQTSVYGEYVFMVDRSGSMNGSHICNAREGLVLFLKSLPSTVLFNVVSFGSYSRTLFPTSRPYNQENLEKACCYANAMRADMGGSELLNPLQNVIEQPLATGRTRNIFLLTDGDISNSEVIFDYLRSSSTKTRVFTFGIGPKIFYNIVSNIASAGRGKAYFACQKSNIQTKIVQCLKETLQPVLCNIKVDWELPESFHIRYSSQDIPFALHGQRLNLFASVTLPSKRRYSLKESQIEQSGVKEFWFDEDFDSCQLGDNMFLEEFEDEDDFLGGWYSTTDIRSQCSDYEPLVDESEEYSSGEELERRPSKGKRKGGENTGYTIDEIEKFDNEIYYDNNSGEISDEQNGESTLTEGDSPQSNYGYDSGAGYDNGAARYTTTNNDSYLKRVDTTQDHHTYQVTSTRPTTDGDSNMRNYGYNTSTMYTIDNESVLISGEATEDHHGYPTTRCRPPADGDSHTSNYDYNTSTITATIPDSENGETPEDHNTSLVASRAKPDGDVTTEYDSHCINITTNNHNESNTGRTKNNDDSHSAGVTLAEGLSNAVNTNNRSTCVTLTQPLSHPASSNNCSTDETPTKRLSNRTIHDVDITSNITDSHSHASTTKDNDSDLRDTKATKDQNNYHSISNRPSEDESSKVDYGNDTSVTNVTTTNHDILQNTMAITTGANNHSFNLTTTTQPNSSITTDYHSYPTNTTISTIDNHTHPTSVIPTMNTNTETMYSINTTTSDSDPTTTTSTTDNHTHPASIMVTTSDNHTHPSDGTIITTTSDPKTNTIGLKDNITTTATTNNGDENQLDVIPLTENASTNNGNTIEIVKGKVYFHRKANTKTNTTTDGIPKEYPSQCLTDSPKRVRKSPNSNLSMYEAVRHNPKYLTSLLNLSALFAKNSQPSLTDLYDEPQPNSLNSPGLAPDKNDPKPQDKGSSSCGENYRSKPSPKRYTRNQDCDHETNAFTTCEWGSVNVTGFLGPDVFRKKVPFCLKTTSSTADRVDLHRMAALRFIGSLETSLGSGGNDDVIIREIVELSKLSNMPSGFTSKVVVDEEGEIVCSAQDFDNSYVLREHPPFPPVGSRKDSIKGRSDDQPPAILVSCPSVDEFTALPTRSQRAMSELDHSSDEDSKYYRLERLAPEGCDQVKSTTESSEHHHRRKIGDSRNLPMKTIQRRRLVSARLTLLTKKMKNAQKLNVFAGPPFIRFILLQAADGYWELTFAFARIIGLPLVQLELAAPFADCTMIPLGDQEDQLGIDGYYDSLALWATAIGLVYLKKKWRSYEKEWELVALKATSWLKNQTLPQGFSYNDVMLAARQAIVLLEQKYRIRAKSEPVGLI